MSMRKTVEADVARLRKVLDDTNIIRLHVESEIESLKEELITLKKNHDTVRGKTPTSRTCFVPNNFISIFQSPITSRCPQDLAELRAQITQAGVRVDVDAPKGQDLARVMEEMRAKYEKIAQKNQEELKAWHESQVIHKIWQISLIFHLRVILNVFYVALS